MNPNLKLKPVQISIKNLKHQAIRSWLMIFFVFLQAFTLFAGSIATGSMESSIKNITDKIGSDVIVVPEKFAEDLRESLFMGQPSTIYFERSWLEKISQLDSVDQITPQLYLATMAASCCDAPVQLIAFDKETDFMVNPWLKDTGREALRKGEVFAGYNIAGDVGDTLKFYDTDFTVASKLSKTGMGYDNSVFMSFETASEFADSKTANDNLNIDNMDNLISMLMINAKPGVSPQKLAVDIQFEYQQDNIGVYTRNSLFNSISENISTLQSYSVILSLLIYITTTIALTVIFSMTINERKKEFGILFTLGAKRRHVTSIITMEAAIISFAGAALGIAVCIILLIIFAVPVTESLGIPSLDFSLSNMMLLSLRTLVIAGFTGLLSSAFSSFITGKEEPYLLIKENE